MSIDLVLCATDLSLEESTAWRSADRLVQALNTRIPVVAMPIVDAEPSATTTENEAVE